MKKEGNHQQHYEPNTKTLLDLFHDGSFAVHGHSYTVYTTIGQRVGSWPSKNSPNLAMK